MKETFLKLVKENISREGIDDLIAYLETTDFFEAPASSKYHCAYKYGLLEHSINVFKLLKSSNFVACLNPSSIAIVALFHDVCKANCYKVDYRNVKNEYGNWEKVPFYNNDEKFPFGHGEKSVYLISKYMKITDEEAMAINWHMGGFDQRVKGGSYSIGEAYNHNILALELHLADMRATYIIENNNLNDSFKKGI